jgi:hypothetical protein
MKRDLFNEQAWYNLRHTMQDQITLHGKQTLVGSTVPGCLYALQKIPECLCWDGLITHDMADYAARSPGWTIGSPPEVARRNLHIHRGNTADLSG